MPAAGRNDVRNIEAGVLLIGVGAVLLLISLFLEWYQPNVDAWEMFEVWDLVLALLAVAALVAVASRMGYGAPRPASHVFGPGIAAFVIVLFALLDPPPLNSALGDGDPATGLWLALAATILMALGALLSVARVSVAFTRPIGEPGGVADPAGRRGPFAPRAGVVDPAATADPVGPAGPAVDPPGSPRASRRFMRGGQPPVEPVDPLPPTDPTRRI